MKNNFKSGISSKLTPFDVAKKCKISPVEFIPILEKGTKHEMEHTDDKHIARRIALDHLVERLDYYDQLDKIEKMKKGGDTDKNFNDKELLVRYNDGESIGFTAIAHLKAQGLIKRSDGTKRKSVGIFEQGGQIASNGEISNLADGTNIIFDGQNPDIRFDNGGVIYRENLTNKELMKNDFVNEQKELQRNSKYAIFLDTNFSNYTNEKREVLKNLKDELIEKLGYNPLINYYLTSDKVILMFDDESNLIGNLEFTIKPKYTDVPRYSPDYIKPEPIFENNDNVFFIEYIFSFAKGNGQKIMNKIKYYAHKYNVDIGLEGSILEGIDGKPIASAKHLQRFYDKQGFINVIGHYFLYNPKFNRKYNEEIIMMEKGGENQNSSNPKFGTGKKPLNSDRRLYTDENPDDTVHVKFKTKQDVINTINQKEFKSKSHKRQSQIINLIHQRVRVALKYAKNESTKERLKDVYNYIDDVKEQSKEKTTNQIKLADGSNTTFDSGNPDIRFNKGGYTDRNFNDKELFKRYNDGMAKGGEVTSENKIYEITRHYFGSLRASSMGGYFYFEGVSLRIKNHLANWNNFYEYHLKNIDENSNPYFLSIVIGSGNSYREQDKADINTEEFVNDHIEENTNLKAEEIVFDDSDTIEEIIYIIDKKMKKITSMAKGGKTISQTPAPLSDRVSGSKTNPKGSASDTEMARSIKFNDSLLKAIENKVKAHNEEYPSKKVTTPTAKAVVRRGMGAYSKSHRPFITGGAPNSRQAWGLARLNKFLLKKRGVKVKSAYVQDDDLL